MSNHFLNFAAAAALALAFACGGDDTPSSQQVVAVAGVSIDGKVPTMMVDDKRTLTAIVAPGNATNSGVTWSSSDTHVATVTANANGLSALVSAEHAGETMITVKTTDGGHTDAFLMYVNDGSVAVTGVALEKALDLVPNTSAILTARIQPANATNQGIVWTSNNATCATVRGNGPNAMVNALANGTATITARTEDGGFTASCVVTVASYVIPVTNVTLDKAELTVSMGRRGTIAAIVQPSNAVTNVTWVSSNTSVLTVSGTGTVGTVTPVALGSATITATTVIGGKTASCNVTVAKPVGVFVAGNYGMYVDGSPMISNQTLRDVFVDAGGNIHAVGEYSGVIGANTVEHRAAHYRNGLPTLLQTRNAGADVETEANGLSMAPNGDAYISGHELFAGGSGLAARLWKNGSMVPLQGVDETGGSWSRAVAVHVFNNDVYVAGYIDELLFPGEPGYDYYKRPVIWKNGRPTIMTDMLDYEVIDFDIDSRGALHVICHNDFYKSWNVAPYTYWTVQSNLTTWTLNTVSASANYFPELLHIYCDGEDSYITGNLGMDACYWRNGARTVLPLPAGTIAAEADNACLHYGQTFIAGVALLSGSPSRFRPVLWEGGAVVTDGSAITDTFLSYEEALSHSVFVQNFAKTPVTSVSLSGTSLSVPVRYTGTLTATVFPGNASFQIVKWASSNPAVATVVGSGNTATVNGVSIGTATITGSSPDGPVGTCTVSVVNAPVTGISLPASMDVGLTRSPAITATIAPYYATSTNVTWTSSNSSVAAVSGTGLVATVTGAAPGTATITARTQEGGFTATCAVRVVPLYQLPEPTVFMAGITGLYVDDRKDSTIGDQWFLYNANNMGGLWDVKVDGSGNVHTVGQHYDPNATPRHRPVYYRNGVRTLLPISSTGYEVNAAHNVCIASDGSVYISGLENGPNGEIATRLWKVAPSGAVTLVPLGGVEWRPGWQFAGEVRERNGDIYLVGGFEDEYGAMHPAIWKNGVKHSLPAPDEHENDLANIGFTSSGDPYVMNRAGKLYKVTPDLSVMRQIPVDDGAPKHMHIYGNDIYLVGLNGSDACYWINGRRHMLEPPAGSVWAEAGDLCVYDGHVYVAGTSYFGPEAGFRIELWIDGRHVTERNAPTVPFNAAALMPHPTPRGMDVRRITKAPVTSVSLDNASLTLALYATETLTATALPASATNKGIAWTSSNPAVVSVTGTAATANGGTATIRGQAEGTATITAMSVDGPVATCAITVFDIPPQSVSIPSTLNVGRNRAASLTATVLPATALNKNVTWSSSNTAVATVTGSGGQTAVVRGITNGSAVITVRTESGGLTATCLVTVAEPTMPVIYMGSRYGLYTDGVYDANVGNQIIHNTVVDASNNVHAVGTFNNGDGVTPQLTAAYYRNGVRTDLPLNYQNPVRESGARAVWVTADNTVYICGYIFAADWTTVARLWKVAPNGTITQEPLQGIQETGGSTIYSTVWAVRERNGDIYVAGGAGLSTVPHPVIWKNGVKYELQGDWEPNMTPDWLFDFGFTTSGTLYAYAYGERLFRASNDLSTLTSVQRSGWDSTYSTGNTAMAGNRIAIVGEDVYTFGYYAAQGAWVWKNGERTALPRPVGQNRHEANSIFAYEGKVYVAGQSMLSNIWRHELWVNGELATIPPVTLAPPMPNTTPQVALRPNALCVKW